MAYDSRVYRVLVASPSDVDEERDTVTSVIQGWNDLHSLTRKIVLLPVRWETHTSPEYGVRPQEVINKQIVDDCDILVGIFWTRIGSPTGVADSGTLEEIERVARSGKPVMLYFSRVAVDPELIKTEQIEKLKIFKEKTLSIGLVESFRTRNEFRDKFAQQLERKVRDLESSESSGVSPIALSFISPDSGDSIGSKLQEERHFRTVEKIDGVQGEDLVFVKSLIYDKLKEDTQVPIVLSVENLGSTSIGNVYVELEFRSDNSELELEEPASKPSHLGTRLAMGDDPIQIKLEKYEPNRLTKHGDCWKIYVEIGSVQPKRLRTLKPYIIARCSSTSNISISAKIYGDFRAAPLTINADAAIIMQRDVLSLEEFMPDWKDQIEEIKKRRNRWVTTFGDLVVKSNLTARG